MASWPNPALEPTAASALRLLAMPSSLCSSAAAQRERWTSTMKCFDALALFLVASCSTVHPSVDVKADLSCRKEKECSVSDLSIQGTQRAIANKGWSD